MRSSVNSNKSYPQFNHQRSVDWMHKLHIWYETESCLCAVQKQALATGYLRACIWGDCSSEL